MLANQRIRRLSKLQLITCFALGGSGIPAGLSAQDGLTGTIADLANRKAAFEAARVALIERGETSNLRDAWEAWYEAVDQYGGFVTGYLSAAADLGGHVGLHFSCSLNLVSVGEASIERLIAARAEWGRHPAEVLREWLQSGRLVDEAFLEEACSPPSGGPVGAARGGDAT